MALQKGPHSIISRRKKFGQIDKKRVVLVHDRKRVQRPIGIRQSRGSLVRRGHPHESSEGSASGQLTSAPVQNPLSELNPVPGAPPPPPIRFSPLLWPKISHPLPEIFSRSALPRTQLMRATPPAYLRDRRLGSCITRGSSLRPTLSSFHGQDHSVSALFR